MNNRDKIEERDLHLIEKFRSIVKSKENEPVRKPARQTWKFWLLLVCAGVIVAGSMVFRKQPAPPVPILSEPPATLVEQEKTPPIREADQTGKQPAVRKMEPKSIAGPLNSVAPPLIKPNRSAETSAPMPSTPIEQGSARLDIQISEIVSCSSVSKRQYVAAKTIFSLKKESNSMVWMTVLSDNPPFTLTHVYYVNGRKYCSIPLKIRFPRMRTWSSITLNSQDQIGKWRVEVVTGNGEKIAQLEFTIVE